MWLFCRSLACNLRCVFGSFVSREASVRLEYCSFTVRYVSNGLFQVLYIVFRQLADRAGISNVNFGVGALMTPFHFVRASAENTSQKVTRVNDELSASPD